jgi:arylsulfatase A-like enzyme
MQEKPNLVLICVDQWRGDCLGINGHPIVSTPFLDRMATEGVRFTRAYSAVPSCVAARAALFTGLSQRSHGRVGYRDGVLWDYPVTVAGEFTRHGYQTQAIGKMHVYPERSQVGFQNVILHDGFLHFPRRHAGRIDLVDDYVPWLRQHLGREADFLEHGVDPNSYIARPWDKPEYTHPTNYVITQALDFLRRRDPGKPFFLFLSFFHPHPPYTPPRWAFDQYLHRKMPEVPVGDWTGIFSDYAQPHRSERSVGEIEPALLQRARAGYYGLMTHIDHQLNRFFEALMEYGQYNNTFFCFVSDHGEMLGDHHLFRKTYPYEGSACVPLLLKGPRGSELEAGSAYRQLAELRDVMPTLLDCAGLPVPEGIEGESLLPLASGKVGESSRRLHGEHTFFDQSLHWVTDGIWKYIWFSGTGAEQLFDLKADPQERHDLAARPESAAELGRWRQALIEELNGREEGFSDGEKLVSGRPVRSCLSHIG